MEVQVPGSAVAKEQLSDKFFWASGRSSLAGTTVRTVAEEKNETTHPGLFCDDLLWVKKLTLSQKIYYVLAKPST